MANGTGGAVKPGAQIVTQGYRGMMSGMVFIPAGVYEVGAAGVATDLSAHILAGELAGYMVGIDKARVMSEPAGLDDADDEPALDGQGMPLNEAVPAVEPDDADGSQSEPGDAGDEPVQADKPATRTTRTSRRKASS